MPSMHTAFGSGIRCMWIDYFQERELIEIGIPGANSPDAVFAH